VQFWPESPINSNKNIMDRVSQLKQEIDKVFKEQLTANQLWAITKLCKHVRLRARNNSAFNNLFNSLFPHARFRQVTKTKKDGSQYPGLSITVDNNEVSEDEED